MLPVHETEVIPNSPWRRGKPKPTSEANMLVISQDPCQLEVRVNSALGLTRLHDSSAILMIERIQAIDLLWDRAESVVKR
jgi:hypothetical protein